MTADTSATETQADSAAQPQAGDPPAQAADAQQPQAGSADDEGAPDLAALQRELAAARRESAGYRTKLRTYEDRDKSDADKAAERVAELERELSSERIARQEVTVRMTVTGIAQRLGFWDPDIAYRLISLSDVEYAEDGSPKNVEALLRDVAKAKPRLVSGTGDVGLGPRGAPASASADMNARIRRLAGRT
jgi:hypothetical protein